MNLGFGTFHKAVRNVFAFVAGKSASSKTPSRQGRPYAFLAAMILALSCPPLAQAQNGFNPDKPSGSGNLGATAPQHNVRPQDVVKWQSFDAVESPSHDVTAMFRLTVNNSWQIYSKNLKFSGPPGFMVAKINAPKTKRVLDPLDPVPGKEVDVYEGGEFEIVFSGAPRWTADKFPVGVTYVGCTDVICLFPYTENLELPFRPASEAPLGSPPTPSKTGDTALPASTDLKQASTVQNPQGSLEANLAKSINQPTSFGLLLLAVFVGGILSNLTPCVYPMIPITLRVLARQSGNSQIGAAAYASGIIITYTCLGLVTALSGGLFGSLLASKPLNIAFALLMLILGLSMLGFGDFTKIQMLGQKLGSGKPSTKNAFLMGIGAGFVASPCTGPILAALLAYTARQENSIVTSGTLLFGYSLGFGLPYMLLGGAAAKVSKIKVSYRVQIGVKILFASVMFALAFYYMRIPFYGAIESMRGAWQPIAVSALGVGTLVLGVSLFVKSLATNKYAAVIPAIILGTGFFASSQWLTGAAADSARVPWYKDEASAFEAARQQNKRVLIDMWAEWCEACKKMDTTTFQDPLVLEEISKYWIPLKLDLTELDEKSEKIQTHYSIQSLPTLVLSVAGKDPAKYHNIGGSIGAADLLKQLGDYRDRTR
jgi:thiol:disulfide interchange protein DsbD